MPNSGRLHRNTNLLNFATRQSALTRLFPSFPPSFLSREFTPKLEEEKRRGKEGEEVSAVFCLRHTSSSFPVKRRKRTVSGSDFILFLPVIHFRHWPPSLPSWVSGSSYRTHNSPKKIYLTHFLNSVMTFYSIQNWPEFLNGFCHRKAVEFSRAVRVFPNCRGQFSKGTRRRLSRSVQTELSLSFGNSRCGREDVSLSLSPSLLLERRTDERERMPPKKTF